MPALKLYMILLGCKPKGRNTEQHDVFFGIGHSLDELYPDLIDFWSEAKEALHIDAWREVNIADGHKIEIVSREMNTQISSGLRLFFINLGGYQEMKFEEQHHFVLSVQQNKMSAVKKAKDTFFFQNNRSGKAASHIDEKYGIDVDDMHQIDDMLIPSHKAKYKMNLSPHDGPETDAIHLGYHRLTE